MGRLLLELGLVMGTPLLLHLVRYFSWGAAVGRLAMLALLFAFVSAATRHRGYLTSVFESRRRVLLLVALVATLGALHVWLFARDIARGGECLTDMGRPSICAGEWLRRGLNPWADCADRPARSERSKAAANTWSWCVWGDRCIDRRAGHAYPGWSHHGPGFDFMDGYKYGPLMALTYAPFVHELRERGLYVVNMVFWLAQCVLIMLLARAAYPAVRSAPWRALLILLLPLAIPTAAFLPTLQIGSPGDVHELSAPEPNTFILELTRRCSNDIIPVVLALLATLLAARRRSRAAGVLLGLSLASKHLPGLLLCLLLPRLQGVRGRALLSATVATTTLCYLPFFLWGPREMFANLVLFSVVRPTNSSSIRGELPASLESLVTCAQLALCAILAVQFHRRGCRDLGALLRAGALLCIAFVALNKVVHGNYLLWLQPFVALALAGLPYASPDGELSEKPLVPSADRLKMPEGSTE
jgi:hypothetical protein